MSDKEKRKSNPRRRLLIRLLIGIAIIVALISAGYDALRPKGAQIVFIAPDDNGVDNIWIADLNDPENPRQLTYREEGILGQNYEHYVFQVAEANNVILYSTGGGTTRNLWRIDTITGNQEHVMTCDSDYNCNSFILHPNGNWIAYTVFNSENDFMRRWDILVHNLNTSETLYVDTVNQDVVDYFTRPSPRWVGITDVLTYISDIDEFPTPISFFNVENRNLETEVLNVWYPHFNNNGSVYSNDNQFFPLMDNIDFRDTNHPDDVIFSVDIDYARIFDWHPNNDIVLIMNETEPNNEIATLRELVLYNITTGIKETLMSNNEGFRYFNATFNSEGSQILYTTGYVVPNGYESPIMLYDMETGEGVTLSLFGHSPQWVNGGR